MRNSNHASSLHPHARGVFSLPALNLPCQYGQRTPILGTAPGVMATVWGPNVVPTEFRPSQNDPLNHSETASQVRGMARLYVSKAFYSVKAPAEVFG